MATRCRRPAQHDHAGRLADALRYQPCSPRCANWAALRNLAQNACHRGALVLVVTS